HLARGQARQVGPFLRLRPEARDVVRAEGVVRPHGDADRGVAAAELLDAQRIADVVEAGAAVLLGNQRSAEAERTELPDDAGRELVALVVGRDRVPDRKSVV